MNESASSSRAERPADGEGQTEKGMIAVVSGLTVVEQLYQLTVVLPSGQGLPAITMIVPRFISFADI